MRDSREFMENLKLDLFNNQVFVFTPKGDVMGFPSGSTPIDFAYHVHTTIGHHCIGAKINGKIVPLDYQLRNGDICEALVNKSSPGPSLDWLSICKTSSAKHKIKQWFRKNRRDENVIVGREIFEREIARNQLTQVATAPFLTQARRAFQLLEHRGSLRGHRLRRRLGHLARRQAAGRG